MSIFTRHIVWELRHLARTGGFWLVCGALLAAGLVAAWTGQRRLDAHRAEIAALPARYAEQMERIAHQFSPIGEAGYVSYYTFYPTYHPLTPLGALAQGVRDIVPDVLWVRLLGIEGQLYESDLGNPLMQALGTFDLAFVWCALAPLALLILAHDVFTRDRDAGRLPLISVQGGSLAPVLLARVGVRFVAVGLSGTVAFGIAALALGVPWDRAALGWLGTAWAQLACWAGLVALIAVLTSSVAASLALALTTWVSVVVLAPALLNLALVTAFPVREGLELTVRQRQESHAAWDKPRAETMDKFFAQNPDWSGTPAVTGRFAWRWYYAMQEMGDQSVAVESRAYRDNLRARQAATARVAWLLPPVHAQLALSARAGTDLDAHLDYLDRVRAFHAQVRHRFYPLFFAEASITPADYAAFPRFEPVAPAPSSGPSSWPLLLTGAAAFALSLLLIARSPVR